MEKPIFLDFGFGDYEKLANFGEALQTIYAVLKCNVNEYPMEISIWNDENERPYFGDGPLCAIETENGFILTDFEIGHICLV